MIGSNHAGEAKQGITRVWQKAPLPVMEEWLAERERPSASKKKRVLPNHEDERRLYTSKGIASRGGGD